MIFRKNYFPTYKILEIYEKYLKSVQLDPETIIKRFTTKQTPTIFVEFAKTGEGLVSFMNVLAAIASKQKISIKELFDKAVIFHILQARALNNLRDASLQNVIIQINEHMIRFNNFQLIDTNLIEGLAGADSFNDRLVPKYSLGYDYERNINPAEFVPSKNAQLIIFRIIHHLIHDKKKVEDVLTQEKNLAPEGVEKSLEQASKRRLLKK